MFEKLIQVGFVTKEFDRILKSYTDIYGIGPWYILKFCPENVKLMEIYGKKQDYAMNVAVCPLGDIRFEYIEPLTPSIFSEFYEQFGEYAVHHLKLGGQKYEASFDFLDSMNIKTIQSGHQTGGPGENIYTFMDTWEKLGFITEIVKVTPDFIKPEPEKWYFGAQKNFNPIFIKASMVGIIVKNIDKKIAEYEKLKIGPWKIFEKDRNKSPNFYSKIAFCRRDNYFLKLIQPEPGSVFMTHLLEYGEGVHHIKMEVENYDRDLKYLRSKNLDIIYSGSYLTDEKFSLIDSRKHLNFIVEISEKKLMTFKKGSDSLTFDSLTFNI